MNRLSARDLMTAELVTIPLATPVPAIARLLGEHGVSAVPVLAEGGEVMVVPAESVPGMRAVRDRTPPMPACLRAGV